MSYLDNLSEFQENISKLDIPIFKDKDVEFGDKLGSGATGSVYEGSLRYNGGDSIDCAAKKFSSNNYHSGYEGDMYDDAYNELSMLSMLMNESGCITVYGYTLEISEEDQSLKIYVLLEKLNSKGDLFDYLKQPLYWRKDETENTYSMNIETKKDICMKMCDCVQDLHNNHIVHCDLKPQNMIYYTEDVLKNTREMISRKGLKLIDFGASVKMDSTKSSEIKGCDCDMGTEGYMAPELKDGLVGYKTDIYSLGVTIIEVWTGDVWIEGESESYAECRKDVLTALKKIEDKSLQTILKRCLFKDSVQRPPIKTIKTILQQL